MSIEVEKAALEKACREMIETILFCLPNAYKGTIYSIGKPPNLIVERITSGIINRAANAISWGLPELSEYNPPGKPWTEYRDMPGRPLEAMGWCVERQKSWTAESPVNDVRSVRLQVEGVHEDYHHMEPVLVHKSDLHMDMFPSPNLPRNQKNDIIWSKSDYVVVAVIKIHFEPHTISIGSPETKFIKRLSRSLGTELLSYQLRQDSMDAMQQLAKDRLETCNILADSLRNVITKAGLVFSAIKLEIGHLRDQWEEVLLRAKGERNEKREAVLQLKQYLTDIVKENETPLGKNLYQAHNRFLELSLPPEKGEQWVSNQIEAGWKALMDIRPQEESKTRAIWSALNRLKKSLYLGMDPDALAVYEWPSEELKMEWVPILYAHYDRYNPSLLNQLIDLLSEEALDIPSRERSRKILMELKALADTMSELERNTNFLLRQVLNGKNGREKEEFAGQAGLSQMRFNVEQGLRFS